MIIQELEMLAVGVLLAFLIDVAITTHIMASSRCKCGSSGISNSCGCRCCRSTTVVHRRAVVKVTMDIGQVVVVMDVPVDNAFFTYRQSIRLGRSSSGRTRGHRVIALGGVPGSQRIHWFLSFFYLKNRNT